MTCDATFTRGGLTWDVSLESFVPSLCCYFRLPGTRPEEKK